jgi:hypothetical protein
MKLASTGFLPAKKEILNQGSTGGLLDITVLL